MALTMAGFAYLAYVLACYAAKVVAAGATDTSAGSALARGFHATFTGWSAIVLDIVGPLWMLAGLYMVIRASRQHRIISWSWLLITCQCVAAIFVASWAALSAHTLALSIATVPVSWSPVLVALAVVIWFCTLIWLIVDGVRLNRLGPSLKDGFKTMTYRS